MVFLNSNCRRISPIPIFFSGFAFETLKAATFFFWSKIFTRYGFHGLEGFCTRIFPYLIYWYYSYHPLRPTQLPWNQMKLVTGEIKTNGNICYFHFFFPFPSLLVGKCLSMSVSLILPWNPLLQLLETVVLGKLLIWSYIFSSFLLDSAESDIQGSGAVFLHFIGKTVVSSYKKTKMLYFFRIPKQNSHQNCVLGPMWFQVGLVSTSDIETTALHCYLVETDR